MKITITDIGLSLDDARDAGIPLGLYATEVSAAREPGAATDEELEEAWVADPSLIYTTLASVRRYLSLSQEHLAAPAGRGSEAVKRSCEKG